MFSNQTCMPSLIDSFLFRFSLARSVYDDEGDGAWHCTNPSRVEASGYLYSGYPQVAQRLNISGSLQLWTESLKSSFPQIFNLAQHFFSVMFPDWFFDDRVV